MHNALEIAVAAAFGLDTAPCAVRYLRRATLDVDYAVTARGTIIQPTLTLTGAASI